MGTYRPIPPRLPAVLRAYRDVLRAVPELKRHKLGAACVSYRVRGRRRWVYFGPWGSRAARAKYRAFVRAWPAQLDEARPPGVWPGPRLLTHAGRTMRLTAWAKETGLRAGTIAYRLDVLKWSIERALTTPRRGSRTPGA
jgi:hypothetical protein